MGAETAPEFARRMEDAGACAVAVHGRFAEQLYRGRADWGVVARVKEAVGVPVVGNGDVRCGADAVAHHGAHRLRRRDDRARRRGQPVGVRPGQGRACGRARAARPPCAGAHRHGAPPRAAARARARARTSCACASTPCGTWRACPAPPPRAAGSTPACPWRISTRVFDELLACARRACRRHEREERRYAARSLHARCTCICRSA